MHAVCLLTRAFICIVLHSLFFRLGRGDQTLWSASRMGAQVPFRNHNELTSPSTQPGRRPEGVDGHCCCMSQGVTHILERTFERAPQIDSNLFWAAV